MNSYDSELAIQNHFITKTIMILTKKKHVPFVRNNAPILPLNSRIILIKEVKWNIVSELSFLLHYYLQK